MGVLLALVGALAFSFMNVFIRKGVRPGDTDNGVLMSMLVNVALFSVLLVVLLLTVGIDRWSSVGFAWFVVAGLASTYLGRQALFGGIRHIGAARAAAVKNATPLVTLVIALTFLGERLVPLATAGIVLVLVGLFALVRESLRAGPRSMDADREADPVEDAFESEAIAEAGVWDRTRDLAGRTVAMINATSRRTALLGIGLAALAAIFFGSGHAFRKVGMDLWPDPLVGAAIGSWTATVAYLATAAIRGQLGAVVTATVGTYRPYFIAAGVAGTVGQLSFFAALNFAAVSYVSVVAASETVLTIILAAVLAGRIEAITRRVVLPSLAVFGGAALIALSP
jgi:drug/metabolite transporter (DMT)-like permease